MSRRPPHGRHRTFGSFRTWMEVALSDMTQSRLAGALEPENAKARLAFTEEVWRQNEMHEFMGRKSYVTPRQAALLWVREFKKRA